MGGAGQEVKGRSIGEVARGTCGCLQWGQVCWGAARLRRKSEREKRAGGAEPGWAFARRRSWRGRGEGVQNVCGTSWGGKICCSGEAVTHSSFATCFPPSFQPNTTQSPHLHPHPG